MTNERHAEAPKVPSVRSEWRQGLGLAAAALLVMAVMVLESHRTEAFRIPVVDAATYHAQARQVAEGRPAAPEAFWQPPLYPYLLAVGYRLGLTAMLPLRLVHGLAVVAAAFLTWRLARRWLSPRLALVAGGIVAAYGPLLGFATQLLPTGLATVLTLAAVLATLRLRERPGSWRAAGCGAAFGLAALAWPLALGGLAVPAAWCGRRWRRAGSDAAARRAALRLIAALLVTAGAVLTPVALRNRVVSGAWTLISTNGGINFYIGNNPDPELTLGARPGQDWERLTAWPYRLGAATAAEADAFFYAEAVRYARASPAAFTRGLARKLSLLLYSEEIPRNVSLYTLREWSHSLALLVWRGPGFAFPGGLLLPLALLGLRPLWRGGADGRLLLAQLAVLAVLLVLFFPAARYRMPLIPLLAVCAAAGGGGLGQAWRAGRRATASALLAGALVLVNAPRTLPAPPRAEAAEFETWLGVGLQVRGRTEEALVYYDRALARDPDYADAHYYRGSACRALGQRDAARLAFLAALSARPNHEKALHDLAVLHYEDGEVEKAAALLRRAVANNPRYLLAIRHLALAEGRLGHTAEAERLRQRARVLSAGAALP